MAELTADQKDLLVNYLIKKLQAYAVILFGSAAQGRLRQDSDLDIAILTENTCPPYELFLAAQELADLLKREIDLIDFKQASTVFQAQIVGKSSIMLYDGDPLSRQYAFMRALKEYALLNEEREEILTKTMLDLARRKAEGDG